MMTAPSDRKGTARPTRTARPGRHGATDAAAARRWSVALHESGHVVAAAVLLGDTCPGAVLLGGGGFAFLAVTEPLSFESALAVAAGAAAEELAERHAPPPTPEPVGDLGRPLPTPAADDVYVLTAFRTAKPDALAIAEWCIRECPDEPERWRERHAWLDFTAKWFVHRNELEILSIATKLFVRGIVTLFSERK